jgi:hypothetical protein
VLYAIQTAPGNRTLQSIVSYTTPLKMQRVRTAPPFHQLVREITSHQENGKKQSCGSVKKQKTHVEIARCTVRNTSAR